MNSKRITQILPYLIIPIAAILIIGFFSDRTKTTKTSLKYYQVISLFNNDEIKECSLNFSSGVLTYKTVAEPDKSQTYTVPSVDLFLSDTHSAIVQHNIDNPDDPIIFDYKAGSSNSWWMTLLPSLIFSMLLFGAMFWMMRRMNESIAGENNRAMSFGKAHVKDSRNDKKKTTFDDVAGADEEKEELQEIVEYLKNPQAFSDIGARIPKGVLLVGPPGTGKTLLARAVAGEADVPFFSISGSDFVEMYVGVGASRVRDLFNKAKKESPAIIFIDEIDAVGRHRGAGMGGGHDEREQTLNQLLVEMDGFGQNDDVIVIAATNRPDILDPALLRPGRFDRQVTVSAPDLDGREAILKVHAKGKSIAPDVKLREIAKDTVGFTGADLENLLNEAALLAARRKKKAITMPDIEEATMKVIIGTEKKSHKQTMEDKKITANHEAGHAVATYFLPSQDPVTQVSIIPRGLAGGFTLSRPEKDTLYMSKGRMLDSIVVLLGGRVAEALTIGDICTGASNDIERATEIARDMVTKYGMSDKLGPINYSGENHEVFLGRDYGNVKNYSENIAAIIDDEVETIINDAYRRTEAILKEHIDLLNKLADYLIEHEKIDGEKFTKLMQGIDPDGGDEPSPALQPQEA
ncbi:MAG: ATP-dependent zinc metalloprotease FtsH [Clostridia bacterium]|nr:ATP-dependent zinc metalloprotease FtsH [Clostridia bacterium]